MYFTGQLVEDAFFRLRYVAGSGKSGAERTSALMYFLAFDAVHRSLLPYSLDPNSEVGRHNRNEMARHFSRLVAVHNLSKNSVLSVSDLGELRAGTPPEKRISSNFLTVPMKKSSQKSTSTNYPGRPVPMLRLGPGLGAGAWGIAPHEDWRKNIGRLFEGRKSKTPFTDAAVFIFRDTDFIPKEDIQSTIGILLKERFSDELARDWKNKLSWEKRFFICPEEWCIDTHHNLFCDKKWLPVSTESELKKRIKYLEGILDSAGIEY